MISTWLTKKLGIEHPICSAGMGRVSQAALVVAVSEAGGCGVLGGVSYAPDALRDEIRAIRRETSKPFGVNIVAPPGASGTSLLEDAREDFAGMPDEIRDRLRVVWQMFDEKTAGEQMSVALEERPPLLVLTFGAPRDFIASARARGIIVASMVGNVRAALKAQASGVDLLIAQGHEAGGHTGAIATSVLVPAVVDATRMPVLAAGGIADGRGLAAALSLGACGAWVGTRFAGTHEAFGHERYKKRLLEAEAADTVITRAYSGKTLRAFGNRWTRQWETGAQQPKPFPKQYTVAGARAEAGFVDGDVDEGMMPAGQNVSLIRSLEAAGSVVSSMSREAKAILTTSVWDR